ncbi:MAG: cellulose binding domain-containing protein [Pseudomonadota bacterium]
MIVNLPNGVTLDLEIEIINDWNSGFVTRVTLANVSSVPLTGWSLDLDMGTGTTVQNSNQMDESQDGDIATFAPDRNWLNTISPNETVSFTFRSSRTPDAVTNIQADAFTVEGERYDLDDDGPLPITGITSELIVKDTWATGAWLQVRLTNNDSQDLTDWRLPIDLAGLTFARSGAVDFIDNGDGTGFLVPKQAFLTTIASGDSVAIGFNVSGDPALVNSIVLSAPDGTTAPDAVNDFGLAYDYDTATSKVSIDVADVLQNDSAADGGPLTLVGVDTATGGGASVLVGNTIEYTVQPTERGQVVINYDVEDSDGVLGSAQIFVDLPEAPILNVDDVTVNEADGSVTFDVTLTGALSLRDTVEVDVATREGSALAGADFLATSDTLVFTDTSRTQSITVDLVDNPDFELTEAFDLLLSNAKGAEIGKHAGVATIVDDAGDTGPFGTQTEGLDVQVSLAGEFVVGHTFGLTLTNTSGETFAGAPVITVGVQDGMKLVTSTGADYREGEGSSVTQDGQATVQGSHDDRYYTFQINPAAGRNPDLADGTWDPGDTANIELFFRGSHFFKPLEERIEIAPTTFELETPERDFTPLDLTYKGFNTSFLNRTDVTPEDVDASFEEQQALGANSIAIVTTNFMENTTSTEVFANDFTMTDEDLVSAIQSAKEDGLNVLLKPHIDLESGQFRGRLLSTAGPAAVEEFFGRQEDGTYAQGSYGELITRYATIAEAEGVDIMLIGTELVDLAKNRANLPYWTQLIEDVRAIYSGDLSYATIVGEELFVRFWDQLDQISLDIYPPLTENLAPSVGELYDGWTDLPTTERGLEAYFNQPITDLIAGLSEQYGKKVLITETGFRSVDGAAARPFDFDLQGAADLQEQLDAYEAFFEAAEDEMGAYLDGLFLWEYPTEPSPPDGTIVNVADYSPQNKPVEGLISDFFEFA